VRVVVQRVSNARVTVDAEVTGQIRHGFVVLAGFAPDDTDSELEWMAEKLQGLRVFGDADGNMNLSVSEVGGAILLVPNFTLYADCRKGRRPGFSNAAPPERAAELFERFCEKVGRRVPMQRGVFGAHMHVELTNDGPVTLLLDSSKLF
jgi:D-tyrosyl-tRNA(Tyr) deacylase